MYRYLDLFAGAGGLSEGFTRAGYTPVAHVEMDAVACFSLKTRAAYHWLKAAGKLDLYYRYLKQEISREQFYAAIPQSVLNTVLNYEISTETLPDIFGKVDTLLNGEKLDLIIGGPPCQAYSLAGRSRSESKMVGDKRNYLYKLYAEFLKKYQPRYFVFENVTGLLSAKDEDGTLHFDNMRKLFAEYGYTTEYRTLNASDYGVLQNRKRVILIGYHGARTGFYPDIQMVPSNCTVAELFKDLPKIPAGGGTPSAVPTETYTGSYLLSSGIKEKDQGLVTLHQARPNTVQDLEIYKKVVQTWNAEKKRLAYTDLPQNLRTHNNTKCFLDRFKVVAADLPYAQTVVAHLSRDGHYFIHPDARATLAYFPHCDRNQGVDYTSTEMDIHFGRIHTTAKGNTEIKSIDDNHQADEGLHIIYEEECRKLYRKWDNVKHISEKLRTRVVPRKAYETGLWGLSIKTKERMKPQPGRSLAFGVVVTLKEMNGVNRIDDFIKLCMARGWLVSKLDVENQVDIYLRAEEDLDLE